VKKDTWSAMVRWVRRFLFPFSLVILLFASYMTFVSYRTPVSTMRETILQEIAAEVSFDTRVYPVASTLYPDAETPISPRPQYFESVTDRVLVEVVGHVHAVTPTPDLVGDMQVELVVIETDELWAKVLGISPEVATSRSSDTTVQLVSTFELPIEEARALANSIRDEIEVGSREDFTLQVRAVLDYGSEGGATRTVSADYAYNIHDKLIEPHGEPIANDRIVDTRTDSINNHVTLAGLVMPVQGARVWFPLLGVLALAGLTINVWITRSIDDGLKELARIKQKYGARLIRVREIHELGSLMVRAEVNRFADLARLADERDRSILQTTSEDGTETVFYVLDEDRVYKYTVRAS